MSTAVYVFGSIVILVAVFLIVAVLMQQGKSHNLSGTIAGGAETFFGKTKGQAVNKKLSVLTSVVAVLFVLVVIGFYVTQNTEQYSSLSEYFNRTKTEQTVDNSNKADDTADAADDTGDAADGSADAADSEG